MVASPVALRARMVDSLSLEERDPLGAAVINHKMDGVVSHLTF